jgi:quinol-cytochrome oxidoreductase complex cytochrome b subunit
MSSEMTANGARPRADSWAGSISAFPIMAVWNDHLAQYYAPKNMGFWSFFGSLALVVLVLQIVTGLWLAMSYKPSAPRPSRRSSTSCATSTGVG